MAESFLQKLKGRFRTSAGTSQPPPMIDLHCHLLPFVDDGSTDWETTLEMCRMAREDGIRQIVATPHANHLYPYSREQNEAALEQLRANVPELQLTTGCDFHCSYENVQDAIEHPNRYTIGNTRYLLLEFNDFATARQITDTMAVVAAAGFRCIITHPERMALASQGVEFGRVLVEAGGLLQITANSITGFWGSRVQKISERLLKAGLVAIIASDAHDTTRRKPVLSEAWRISSQLIGTEHASELVAGNPQAILLNEEIYAERRA